MPRLRLAIRLALLLALFPAVLAAAGDAVAIRPAPSWVDPLRVDDAVTVPRGAARYGIYGLLSDHQVRVSGTEVSDYFRRVRKIVSGSGVQHASELSFDFDPSYQQLTVHEVTVLRDGKKTGQLGVAEIRVIEKESASDEKIYDGVLTAVVFLKDVRPGDVLDYSWSLDGANSLLSGRYDDEYELSSSVPVRRLRHRLLWPASRSLHHRDSIAGMAPRIRNLGSNLELIWERSDLPAIDAEDSTPEWFEPYETVQLSEFGSWSEVAVWAQQLFRLDARSTAAVKDLAARIKHEHPSDEERIVAAIRFVQDDIRYLGIELGKSSHEPHPPWLTLEQRWGDCKDKVFLLSSLLHELGVEAYPALVNTHLRRELDHRLPSPFLFDHVITQVFWKGQSYWIDGTIAEQGGQLATIETPDDERALIVRPGTTALTRIATNQRGSTLVEHDYTAPDYEHPVSLNVRTTFSGADADDIRSWVSAHSIDELSREQLNQLAADQPKIKPAGAMTFDDDRTRNVVVVRAAYMVPELWKDGQWSWFPRSLDRRLKRPDTMIRSMPLAFPFPLDITETMTFRLPDEPRIDAISRVTESPAFRYESRVDRSGSAVSVSHHLRALRDSLAPSEVPDHLSRLSEVQDHLGYSLGPGTDLTAAGDLRRVFRSLPQSAWVWPVGAALVLYLLLRRSRNAQNGRTVNSDLSSVPPPPVSRGGFRPGESAAAAIALKSADEVQPLLATLACWCGARIDGPAEVQQARYGESELTIASRHCGVCGQEQSLYFATATDS